MDKILTVVIPTYNMEKYLRKCLDSLIIDDQDLIDKLEVLVVNDGSKDSSSDIAHQYQDKYPEVFRVIDKENGNYGSCVNRGLKEAVGKYIKVLDADDTFETNNFSDYLEFLVNNDVDCVISDMMRVDEDGKCKALCRFNFPSNTPFGLDEMGENEWRKLWMHCVCYKTINLRNINYHQTEGISYTDQEWVFKPVTKVNTCTYLPIILYLYLVGREGQTVKNFDKLVMQLEKVIGSLIDFFYKYESTTHHCRKYLLGQIKYLLVPMYQHALYEKILSLETIRAFDASIKKYPEIYHLVDNVSDGFPLYFKYIVYWRKHQYKEIPNILKSISNVGKSLISILRRVKQLFR